MRCRWTRTLRAGVLVALLALPLLACSEPPDSARGESAAERSRPSALQPPWPKAIRTLRFGVAPYADRQVIDDTFRPLIRHLSGRLGIPVAFVVTKDYADLIARLRGESIDFAQIPPASYVRLKEQDPKVQLLATQLTEGTSSYGGYIVVRSDDPAETLDDLAGRCFCYVDPNSASSYILPRALIRKRGYDPDKFFGSVQWGGNHNACLRRVVSGSVDAACVSTSTITAARRAAFPLNRIKVVAKTPRVPWDAYVTRAGLPQEAVERLVWELLSLSTRTPDGRDVLAGPIRMNAWERTDDRDYDVVREALRLGAP